MKATQSATKTSPHEDTRQLLLKTGLEIIWKKGYNHTGLQEILTTAGLPKGSFYHYFKNKEDFGLSLIDYYWDNLTVPDIKRLTDAFRDPKERLTEFFSGTLANAKIHQCSKGCLIGNLAQELADVNATFGKRLSTLMKQYENAVRECLQAGQEKGQFRKDISAEVMAVVILNSQYGALLRMKADKDLQALDIHKQSMLEFVKSGKNENDVSK